MEKTIFEELGIQYWEKDGLYYPILGAEDIKGNEEIDTTAELGRYGRLYLKLLFKMSKKSYYEKFRDGTLIPKAIEANEIAYRDIDRITKRELEKCSAEKKHSTMEMWKLRVQAQATAEEIFINSIIEGSADYLKKRAEKNKGGN